MPAACPLVPALLPALFQWSIGVAVALGAYRVIVLQQQEVHTSAAQTLEFFYASVRTRLPDTTQHERRGRQARTPGPRQSLAQT